MLAGAIAYVTQHLGIAFTASVVQEDPLKFARRISTLDHASKGRIAWNVADDPPGAWTEEYVDVTCKLWEGSWNEDALRLDGRDGKVHRINHRGPPYQVAGPHPVSPSPQRTPLLFRAGASEADRVFAARNAEAVFLQSPSPAAAGHDIADIRARAARHGRLPQDIMFFQGLHVVTGGTEAEARRKAAALDEQADGAPLSSCTAASGRIVGTPEQIADELAGRRAQRGPPGERREEPGAVRRVRRPRGAGPAGAGPDAAGVRRRLAQAQALRPRRPGFRAASSCPLPRCLRAAARLRSAAGSCRHRRSRPEDHD